MQLDKINSSNRTANCVLWAAVLVLLPGTVLSLARADEPFDYAPFVQLLGDYHFRISDAKADAKELEMRSEPIMIWSNPAKFDQKGCVFAWMRDGRPEIIGSMFNAVSSGDPQRTLQLHSFSRQGISGQYKENLFWNPTEPGLRFQPISDLKPDANEQRRSLQIRQLSRQFSVELVDRGNNRQALRLLPTPIMTYEPKKPECLFGSIFAFAATGTDPDALLVIELVEQPEGPTYQFAFARFHFRELNASRNDQAVWHADANEAMVNNFRGSPRYRSSIYTRFRVQ